MVLKDRRSDKTKNQHFISSESQKIKMQVFGLAFVLYYLKLSDGSGICFCLLVTFVLATEARIKVAIVICLSTWS